MGRCQILGFTEKNKKTFKATGIRSATFSIPAGVARDGFNTCPGKGECAFGCYAQMGNYVSVLAKNFHHKGLELTKDSWFVGHIMDDLQKWALNREHEPHALRIHGAGDFYSEGYLKKWFMIADLFSNIHFYAYTKMIPLFRDKKLPKNFTVIFSYGGIWDDQINPSIDRHSAVFKSIETLKSQNYSDASNNDAIAFRGVNHRIGLIWHGNHVNKAWEKYPEKTKELKSG